MTAEHLSWWDRVLDSVDPMRPAIRELKAANRELEDTILNLIASWGVCIKELDALACRCVACTRARSGQDQSGSADTSSRRSHCRCTNCLNAHAARLQVPRTSATDEGEEA